MKVTANINGYRTTLEIPNPEQMSNISYNGSKESYEIDYGNGLVELGGIVEIEANSVIEGIIEGNKSIILPFSQTLSVSVTSLNVADTPANITGENAFYTYTNNGFSIYATAKANATKTMKVSYVAKGIK